MFMDCDEWVLGFLSSIALVVSESFVHGYFVRVATVRVARSRSGAAGLHAIDQHPGGEIGAVGGVEGDEDAVVEEGAVVVGGVVVVPEVVGGDAHGCGADLVTGPELEVDEGLGAGGDGEQQEEGGEEWGCFDLTDREIGEQ